jgi:hypothetical protein
MVVTFILHCGGLEDTKMPERKLLLCHGFDLASQIAHRDPVI